MTGDIHSLVLSDVRVMENAGWLSLSRCEGRKMCELRIGPFEFNAASMFYLPAGQGRT
jgi:hypothetical protein